MIPTLIDAVRALYPDVSFSVSGDTIVKWDSDLPQPDPSEIQAKLIEMQNQWQRDQWIRDRVSEYPTLDTLIVALWEQVIEGRPTSAADLQVLREAVKQRYPKP